jgi:predicted NBD/HSP70 family sugar kinase
VRYYKENSGSAEDLTFLDLLQRADEGERAAVAALEKMAHYLGRGMRLVVAGLAPERIVFVGDLTRAWHRFGPVIESDVQAQMLPGGCVPQLIAAHEDGMARLRGTVALVLQKHFGAPYEMVA